jgi:hypothetical protein
MRCFAPLHHTVLNSLVCIFEQGAANNKRRTTRLIISTQSRQSCGESLYALSEKETVPFAEIESQKPL